MADEVVVHKTKFAADDLAARWRKAPLAKIAKKLLASGVPTADLPAAMRADADLPPGTAAAEITAAIVDALPDENWRRDLNEDRALARTLQRLKKALDGR
jgi:hypothetical protein